MDYVNIIIIRSIEPQSEFHVPINVLAEISRETAAYGLPNTGFDGIIPRSR